MAAKKYATTEVLNAKGKPTETRAIDASKETVKGTDEKGKVIDVKITDVIFDFVTFAAQEKAFKEKKENAIGLIRTLVSDIRDYFGKKPGYKKEDFTKTFRLLGTETDDIKYAVDVSSSDKFALPTKKEDMAALKKLLTAGVYKQIIEESATISIKKTVTDDDKKRKELTKLLLDTLGEEKLKEYFERDVEYSVKPGLSALTYEFPEAVQEAIRSNIKSTADAVKDASEVIKK
jgi:hypothetical protein